jgi:ribosome biogenesis GTPase
MRGVVIRLDRGWPLVLADNGIQYRCEHATSLVKNGTMRATTGDVVEISLPEGHEVAVIESIAERKRALVRRDPAEKTAPQVLAANFDTVLVAEPLSGVNVHRLERELVLAYESGAKVAVLLTKADLAADEASVERVRSLVERVAYGTEVIVVSAQDPDSVEKVRALIPEGTVAILLGRSGVGKSSLVNLLVGSEVQQVGTVRERDGKGRHTTVSRQMIAILGGGYVIDMPGVRGLALWNADEGMSAAFADIEELAKDCRFRDCRHEKEPGCAVRKAVEEGRLAPERLESYRRLKQEARETQRREQEAARIRTRTGHPRRWKG